MDSPGGSASAPPVRIGEILAGKYRVERLLGVGAMGVVVAATHVDLHELRAIKLMLPSMLGDVEGVERFLREARAVSRLRSRHVAAVYDVGRLDTGAPFIVMEHLEGSDLKSVLNERGVLSPEEAATYVSEACEALSEAHAVGIVHRDIKPANLFLATRAGSAPTIKVLDFGIAKVTAAPGSPAAMDMTQTKEILGTPLYMSPEQMRSMRSADARSDIWSLGVILYRSLVGKVPFSGETITEVCIAVLGDTPEPPSKLRPDLPAGLEAVILGCLEKDPARRIGSAAELATALAPFVVSRPRQPSITSERTLLPAPPSGPAAGEMTDAATLHWKPGATESREQTSSRASWSNTDKLAITRPRRRIVGAIVLVLAVVGFAIVGGSRLFARPSNSPALGAATPSSPPPSVSVAPVAPAPVVASAPVTSSAPVVTPAPVKDLPTPSGKVTAKPPRAPLPAPSPSTAPKAPQAPPAPTGDIFGNDRH